MKNIILTLIASALLIQPISASEEQNPRAEYHKILRETAQGWNSWDTRSVFTQVYLPETFAIKMSVRDCQGSEVNDLRIGNSRPDAAVLKPSDHSTDGSVSDIHMSWHGISLRLQTASRDDDLVILVTPECGRGCFIIRPQLCWQLGTRYSDAWCEGNGVYFTAQEGGKNFHFHVSGTPGYEDGALICGLDSPIVISTLGDLTAGQAREFIDARTKECFDPEKARFGDKYKTYSVVRNILAWDTIFDPSEQKIFTTVSRNWNVDRAAVEGLGGYAIFEWDNYFAAMMLSLCNRNLAYLNAIENTLSVDECGFVPNVRSDHGLRSFDRSEPPVGAMTVWTLYCRFGDKWLLSLLFDRLLEWNRWWDTKRQCGGLLCYGSNRYPHIVGRENEYRCGNRAAAILESGMDNSPMYDNAVFDAQKELLNIQDVGLTSLYIADCRYLLKIAEELGRKKEAAELKKRAESYAGNATRFWCEEDAMYYNIDAVSGKFVKRCSPTSFYPLIAGIASEKQASELIERHLMNPDEFWGEWVIPSTPRNDSAFADNTYWRGRIWAPLNFLVYLGLRNYGCGTAASKELSDKSEFLLMKEWQENGYIYENYSAVTGCGDDAGNSDSFYCWGALLGYISLMENPGLPADSQPMRCRKSCRNL